MPRTVGVRNGTIAAITDFGTELSADRVLRLAPDEVLLPGLVDTPVHVNDPGRTEWEGFVSATRAAAAGGVTTIVDMPLNSLPPTVDVAALEVKRMTAEQDCFVDVGFWGGAIPSNVAYLRPLHDAGSSRSSASWPTPVSRSSRGWSRPSSWPRCGRSPSSTG